MRIIAVKATTVLRNATVPRGFEFGVEVCTTGGPRCSAARLGASVITVAVTACARRSTIGAGPVAAADNDRDDGERPVVRTACPAVWWGDGGVSEVAAAPDGVVVVDTRVVVVATGGVEVDVVVTAAVVVVVTGGGKNESTLVNCGGEPVPQRHPSTSPSCTVVAPAPARDTVKRVLPAGARKYTQ